MHTLIKAIVLLSLLCSHPFEAKQSTAKSKAKISHPVPGKTIKTMDEQELALTVEYAKKINDSELVFKAFAHLITKCKDHTLLKVYKLDLADFCFGLEDFTKAALKYEEFVMLYPGSAEAEYAKYKLILCTFYLSLDAHHDQTNTAKTISLIELFLQQAQNQTFIAEVETIFKTCRKRLLEHEAFVFETYLKREKFTGAQHRIEFIQEHFKDIEGHDQYVAYLQQVYETVKNPSTRPFLLKVDLEQALAPKAVKKVKKSDVQKAVSFFVA